jgi:hypothetical protein
MLSNTFKFGVLPFQPQGEVMDLLSDARSLSRKVKKNNLDTQTKKYVARIQKLILKHAAMGCDSISIEKVPYCQQYIGYKADTFMAIAKTFAKLGFTVSYSVRDKDEAIAKFKLTPRKKAVSPFGYSTALNISWNTDVDQDT